MTEPKDEDFPWIRTHGDGMTKNIRVYFGRPPDDPMPFILTVTQEYVASKTRKTLPLTIQEMQNYCTGQREQLRKIARNCKQRGLNAEVLT